MVGTGTDPQASVEVEGNSGVSDQLKSLQINNNQQADDHGAAQNNNGTATSLSPSEKKDEDGEQGDEPAVNESQG
ncbi:hypothetical protein MKW94_000508 [Papaver nudicaule]|uniref:Uncharacterized protein n=1 Tax=Papaver nudicaule TaxID=74823 RepID=A0AA41VPW8_PAPNU|nr:hypothetical protein [Papaver nudicaule]